MNTTKPAKSTARDLTLIAACAALMAVCAWITVPVLEIAFTMQTFAVFFALNLLGGKRGTLAIVVYLLLGLVGAPVFSGFQSGAGTLFGVTGGYLAGFLFSGLVYWLVTAVGGNQLPARILATALGLLVCYAFGSAWFLLLYLHGGKSITLGVVLMKCVVPYLIPDAVKLTLAVALAGRLKRRLAA